MMLRIGQALILAGVLSLAGCGDDDDGDGGDSANNPANPNPPSGTAVPTTFSNGSGTKADLDTKVDSVQNDIIADSRTGLGLSSTGSTLRRPEGRAWQALATVSAALQESGDGGASEQADLLDLSAFTAGLESGADCSELYAQLGNYAGYADQGFSYADQQLDQFLTDDFTVQQSDAAGNFYVAEDIKAADSPYAYHVRLTPNTEGDNGNFFAALLPTLELAAGATDSQVAILADIDTEIDFSAFGGDQADADTGGAQAAGKIAIQSRIETFADTAAKTATIGATTAISKSDAEEGNFSTNMVMDVTITGGDNPSLANTMTVTGTGPDGTDLAGYINTNLSKAAENTFVIAIDASFGGQVVDKTVTVSKTGETCSVSASE